MDIHVSRTVTPRPRPPEGEMGFGRFFTDHMFVAEHVEGRGWSDARVVPYAPFPVDPAAGVFHYGQAMFEGAKAFRGADGKVRLFRPAAHAERMAAGAPRLCMPAPPAELVTESLRALVTVDAGWVPSGPGTALYLRPTMIATEGFLGVRPATAYRYFVIASPVGNYYGSGGPRPLRIWVETREVRAARGGIGSVKAGANYAASLHAAAGARSKGYDQVLWLDASEHELVEEVGTMNLFAVIGGTLVTPPLSDSILAGITRDSILTLARELGARVEERPLSIKELRAAHQAGRLDEVFGTGTASVVSPVGELGLAGERLVVNEGKQGALSKALYDTLTGVQRGTVPDRYGWLEVVD